MAQHLLKVDSVMYRVGDLAKAAAFYEDALGLKRAWEDEERRMIGFRLAQSDAEIVLHNNPDIPEFDYSYLVENVEHFVREFKGMGYGVAQEPMAVRSGRYAVLFDPDGNKIPIIDLTAFGGVPRYDHEIR